MSESRELTVAVAPAEQVYKWILEGASEADIRDAIKTNWPKQKAEPLIKTALARLIEASDSPADVMRGWCIEATRELYRKQVEVGDFAGALRAVKLLHDLALKQ